MTHTKQRLGLSLMALVLSLFLSTVALATEQDNTTTKESFVNEFQKSDQSLIGTNPSQTVYFQVLDDWVIDDATITLDYNVTQLTEKAHSNLTLTVNNVAFHSFELENSSTNKQHIQVTIPKELLKSGINTLTIQARLRMNDQEECQSLYQSAEWLTLFKSSSIGINYQTAAIPHTIKAFHTRFNGIDTIAHKQVAILVAGEANTTELESATYILSSYAKIENTDDPLIPLSQLDDSAYNQLPYQIIVGLYDNLPKELQAEFEPEELKEEAHLKLVADQHTKKLILTAKTDNALIKGSRFMANSQLMAGIDQDEKKISLTTETDTPVIVSEKLISFSEYGDTLTGFGHQEKTYFISLPSNRSIAANSDIHLNMRYSENLDFTRSLVTVLINNIPIGSQKLTAEDAANHRISIKIPKDLDVAGDFVLKIAFDLEVIGDACDSGQEQSTWAYIVPESSMTIHTKDRQDLLFSSYPHPFIREGSYNQVAVLLPKKSDDYIYRSISTIFNLLGRYAQDNTGDVLFVNAGEKVPSNILQSSNLIALGSFQDNTVIKDLNTHLYFRYDEQGKGFISNEKHSIESQYGMTIGTGQLIFSPYEEGKGALILTSATSKGVALSASQLANSEKVQQHPGDAFIIDQDGQLTNFRFKEKLSAKDSDTTGKLLKNTNLITYGSLILVVASLLIVGLVLTVTNYQKKGA